ncbi:SDR family NAD(P)-dependent oxidoreductase [Novosphingobium resinovorum]|uniref:Cyclopentanol dehydrogenase n=1 Tax=Novosphingobium resinovorum TaxID=158500 RepID=A0A1D8ADQ1_9SPHN|nr:glucose 1-dehydrogenase [Novosphingobium resinovorum]AOR80220.1 cyclopentanol dehydrogenase [Novosphingobium resinovorum]
MQLSGKRAIVTGAANGLGAAIAIAFAREGARVAVADIDVAGSASVIEAIVAMSGDARACRLDVTREEDWAGTVQDLVAQWSGVDILVNNAAIASGLVPIEDRLPEDWDRSMAINARGPFLGTRALLPVFRANGGGAIVNVASVAGLGQSQIMDPAYACSKAALTMLTRITAAQHAGDGVRCNSVHPGPIDSDLARAAYPDEQAFARRVARVPAGRMAKMDEVVEAVVYLASDRSSYITGTGLAVDGGALVQ